MKKLFVGVKFAPHLKMLNQTTGVWHVEAVSPRCRSLQDAIKERFRGRELNILSIS
jgi:galactitol-specific phosphotransferase system IIC component